MDIFTRPSHESRQVNKFLMCIKLITLLLFALCFNTNAATYKKTTKIKKATLAAKVASIISGKIVDADTKEPLTGATVTVKGSNKTAIAGLDGSFKISAEPSDILVISYIGYVTVEIPVGANTKLGEIALKSSASSMHEVVVNGDIAIDRKTPVAVTSIGAQFIEEKIGNQDIPELLNVVPGVYATASGGGFGDSRISIRGFSSTSKNGNVALTLNGIPVNDMENGSIFWSNWTGLADVLTSVQTQRGLGASKIIVPSFGGTINETTRSTDAIKGGYIQQTIGSDGYDKTAVLISTGLDKNGYALTFAGGRTMGNGNADGLKFLGYNYFFNISKVLSPTQTLSFSLFGATQSHGQRPERPIVEYQNAPQGIRYNYEDGVKDGKEINPYSNFFSKPVFQLNHDWAINDKSSLSTVLYATYGTGGAGSIGGTFANIPRISNAYSPLDYTAVEKTNAASADGSASNYFYASHNDHSWYGLRSTYKTLFGKYLDISAGVDLRYYTGTHYEVVTDLLGADYVNDPYKGSTAAGTAAGNINDPFHRAVVGDKIGFYNKDYVAYGGGYFQAEYSKKDLTAFVTLSGSETGDKRADYFNYLNSDPAQTSKYVYFFTYQAKTGLNYNINAQMNVFANVGYITKAPYFDVVFQKFTNTINQGTVPEKLFSYELGYQYKISNFSATLNLYRSLYKDRSFSNAFVDPATNQLFSENLSGVNEMHQGAELELAFKPIKEITLHASLSYGDWYYTKDAGPVQVFNSQQQLVTTAPQVLLKGLKVGDQPQASAVFYMDVNVLPQFKIGGTVDYRANYNSNFTFSNLTPAALAAAGIPQFNPYKLPNYSLVGLNSSLKFKIAGLDAVLTANVNNLLNTKYISDSFDASALGLVKNLNVYYGLGRTFTTGLKIRF